MTGSAGVLNRMRVAVRCQSSARSDHSANLLLDDRCGISRGALGELLKRGGDRSRVDHLIAVVGLEPSRRRAGEGCRFVWRCRRGPRRRPGSTCSGGGGKPSVSQARLRRLPGSGAFVSTCRLSLRLSMLPALVRTVSACGLAFQLAQMGARLLRAFVDVRRHGAPIRARRPAWCAESRWSCSGWRRSRIDRQDRAPSPSIHRSRRERS